jgi:hypothetical protein
MLLLTPSNKHFFYILESILYDTYIPILYILNSLVNSLLVSFIVDSHYLYGFLLSLRG